VAGQAIQNNTKDAYDSILLSPDCHLDPELAGKIFTRLEIPAEFPGGFQKWYEFANKNFDFNDVIQKIDTTGEFRDSVVLKFIVTRDGQICSIRVQKGNPILAAAATRLLKSSRNWIPGVNGGRLLNSYRTLRIDVWIDRKENSRIIRRNFNSYFRYND
jgi:hypothetical protein